MAEETKIFYYIGDDKSPYVSKINVSPESITLKDFKTAIKKFSYKFFFRSKDKDFGFVKEEIVDDDALLPFCDGRIVAWLVTLEPTSTFELSQSTFQNEQPHLTPDLVNKKLNLDNKRDYSGHILTNQQLYNCYKSHSTLTSSDADTLSFDSREDISEYSTYSDQTVSSRHRKHERRRRNFYKKRSKRKYDSSSIYSGSITDSSMSLNILTVTLNMEKYNFLGISLIGQSNSAGDGGIYIGSIMKGGAVAADERIQPGDMVLQVNDINFENLTNEEAVRALRAIAHKPGPIKLTIAKCWDYTLESNYLSIPNNEPVQPINPAEWAKTINPLQGIYQDSANSFNDASSDHANSLPEAERYDKLPLSIHTNPVEIVKSMKMPGSGLEIKTRMWLKITIPEACIGSDLVNWLHQKVEGLGERRDAKRYAENLLKLGFIRHTVKKRDFSEQCYYVFTDYTDVHNLSKGVSSLTLGGSNGSRDSDPSPGYSGSAAWNMTEDFSVPGSSRRFVRHHPPQQLTVITTSGKRFSHDPQNQTDLPCIYHTECGMQSHKEMQKHVSSSNPPEDGDPGSDRASESHLSVCCGRSGVTSGEKHKRGIEKSFKQVLL